MLFDIDNMPRIVFRLSDFDQITSLRIMKGVESKIVSGTSQPYNSITISEGRHSSENDSVIKLKQTQPIISHT